MWYTAVLRTFSELSSVLFIIRTKKCAKLLNVRFTQKMAAYERVSILD